MAKNLTHKGLAFGAGAALIATSFAAIPATAAVNDAAVSLTPRTGTQYSMVQDNVFDLKTSLSVGAVAGSGNLKYLVTDPDEKVLFDFDGDVDAGSDALLSLAAADLNTATFAVSVGTGTGGADVFTIAKTDTFTGLSVGDVIAVAGLAGDLAVLNGNQVVTALTTTDDGVSFQQATSLTAGDNFTIATADGITISEQTSSDALDGRAAIVAQTTLGHAAVTGLTAPTRESDGSFVVATSSQDSSKVPVLRLVSTATVSHTVTVTAWVDENGNGEIESTEDSSSTRTVTFVPWAASGFAFTLDQPLAGGDKFNGNVAFDTSINASQLTAGRLTVGLARLVDGLPVTATATSALNGSYAFTASDAFTYNSTKNIWEIDGNGATAGVGVAVVFNNTPDPDNVFQAGGTYMAQPLVDGTAYGSAVYKTVGSAVSDAVGNVSASRSDNVRKDSSTAYDVREKTTSVTLTAKVTKSSVAVANAPVVVKVTRVALDSKSTITAGGKSLTSTSTSSSFTYDAVTDASGVVTIELGNSQGKAADSVTVEVTQAGISSTATTLLWQASDVNVTKAARAGAFGNDIIAIAQGGSYTLEYNVFDDFGAAPANDTLRVLVAYTPIGNVAGAAQTAVARSVPVVNGVASISVTDTSTINGTYNVTGTVQKFNKSTGNYDALGTPMVVTTAVHVQADSTPAAVSVTATAKAAGSTVTDGSTVIEAKDFVAVDLRADANQDAPGYDVDTATDQNAEDQIIFTGLVTNAAGAAIAGAPVTLSADGMAFLAGTSAAGVYTIGSITVLTNAAGQYTVYGVSHKTGAFKVTATAGSASKTADVKFAAAAQTAGAALTIDAPASATPGSTYKVTAKLVDKRGNGVAADNATGGIKVAVSYAGPGIVFGSLPTKFEADGTLSFAVLLGTNDNGPATITVQYDGDDTVTTNANAFTVAKTVVVGTAGNTGEYSSWTKKLDDNSAKIYAKNVVGAGKVQFFLNGKEIAWVRATSAADSKLRSANGAAYLVRTVEFADGKNVLEVYVDGVRTTRTAYTK